MKKRMAGGNSGGGDGGGGVGQPLLNNEGDGESEGRGAACAPSTATQGDEDEDEEGRIHVVAGDGRSTYGTLESSGAINDGESDSADTEGTRLPLRAAIRLYAIVFTAVLGGILFGFEISVFSGAKLVVTHDPHFEKAMKDSSKVGFVTSALVLGAFGGSYLAGYFQEHFGRRPTVMLAASVYLLGVAIAMVADAYGVLVLGRLVAGAAVGLLSTTIPVYVAEISPKTLRGRLVTANQLFICIGVLLGYVTDDVFKCPHNGDFCLQAQTSAWRWMLVSATPVAAVLLIAFAAAMPSTPRFLVRRCRTHAAASVLSRLRHPALVQQELREITAAGRAPRASWRAMLRPEVTYGIYIATMLSAIQQFTGVNAVNFYAQTVLTSAGFDQDHAFYFSIYIGVVKVVFVVVGMLLIDTAGRRILMLAGISGMTVSTFLLAAVFQVKENTGPVPHSLAWVALIALFCYMGFFEISLGPAVWLYLSEIFPLQVRGKALSISGATNWLFTYIVGLVFPVLVKAWYPGGVFFVFGAICAVSVVWVARTLPETKGKSLEEIEAEFRAKMSKRRTGTTAHARVVQVGRDET